MSTGHRAGDSNYLLKVLGLSAVPRFVTFGLTVTSLPLMIRALGADQYGTMVYLVSIASMLELFAGFGVSAAAGKNIAACRVSAIHRLHREIARWARLQTIVALVSFLPVIGIGYVLVRSEGPQTIGLVLFLTVAVTLFVSIALTFARSVLQSLLAFKVAAGLDTVESVIRSAGWLVVAWKWPTVLGLAVAGLVTACVASLLGVVCLARILSKERRVQPHDASQEGEVSDLSQRQMLKESVNFVGLSLATRAYQTLPIILLGRMLGFEIVGIIGAFSKIVEIVSLPFSVVGNALMVRAQEIKSRGVAMAQRYWDMLFRICVLAAMLTAAFWLLASDAATFLLPKSPDAIRLFPMMTLLILLRPVADLFAPASDYVGALRSRVAFLFLCAGLQLPAVWGAALVFGETGAVLAIVASYAIMVAGYVFIARGVFFGAAAYKPSGDILLGTLVVCVAAGMARLMGSDAFAAMAAYVLLLAIGFLGFPPLRREYASGRFLKFELV